MTAADQDRIVITGMGLVTPLGQDLAQVWKRVVLGESGVMRDNGRIVAKVAGDFPNDAKRSVQFAVEASLAALWHAGLDSRKLLLEKLGVCLGNSKGNVLALEKALEHGPDASTMEDFSHTAANTAVMRATGACGPCISLVSACATGAHSIAQAARWIMDDQADYVLAGASESSLTPLVLGGFMRMGVLAELDGSEDPRTVSRPYDRARKGFVVGEGAGVMMLERFSSARGRGAKILAELTGWGFSGDAYKPVSFNPNGDSIVRAIQNCAARAQVHVSDMDYINCHGTGTIENDSIETRALKRSFDSAHRQPALSSTKPMTGHLLGAAGSVELILTVLAMQNDFIPATLNLNDPDPECGLDYTACKGRSRNIRNAMSLSYGFGGHVAALAIGKISENTR